MGVFYNTSVLDHALFGGRIIDSTSTIANAKFQAFLTVTATEISAITQLEGTAGITDLSKLVDITIPADTYLPIPFSAIDLTSGVILAINRELD
jgi:hypothetical protein